MRKIIPLWIAAFIALLPSVIAQSPLQSVMNMFERTVGFIFVGGLGMANFVFWGKFLLWILLFAILTYAGNFVFKGKKNIRIIVAAVVALISVIAMPSSIVRMIFEDYGIVVSFFLLAIPLLSVIYLLEVALAHPKIMPEKSRAYYGIKAAGYYILGFVITHIGRVAGPTFNPSMREIWSFASGVCFILFLYNLIRCILGGAEEGGRGPEGGGGVKKFFDWLKKKPERPEYPPTATREEEPGKPGAPTPEGRPTLMREIRKVGEDVLRFYGKTREIVYQPNQPVGRPITVAIVDLYRRWRENPDQSNLDNNLNYFYDELAEKMHEMRVLAESINDQFEAILGHPDIGRVGEGEHAELARIMNQMARAHAIYADGLLMFYSRMAQVGRS